MNSSKNLFKIFLPLFVLLCASITKAQDKNLNLVKYVDPFIGAVGEGHIFPGASLPYGMVKLGPDYMPMNANSGYNADGALKGFSHVHVSGTGGPPKYGNVLVAATTGALNINDYTTPRANEKASPGFFSVTLQKYGVNAEFTVTHSVGFHKYSSQKQEPLNILFDLESFLSWGGYKEEGELDQELVGSEIKILSPTEVEGYTRVRGGWNVGEAYTVYFYAILDKPATEFGTWKSGKLAKGVKEQYDSGTATGAYFTFNKGGETVKMKVGISFLSTGKAKQNIQTEVNHWDFEKVKTDAANEWNKKLNTVIATTKNEDQKKIFYSAIYRTMLMPVNRSGENPKWTSNVPYYDDFYCIWDTYRATHPLLTLIQKEEQIDMINSLLDMYKQEGYMPDARSGNYTSRTQGGSNTDVMIADAYVKGLQGIDYNLGLKAMLKNAEVPPGGDERRYGRGGLRDYNTIGYVSTDFERAGSRTMEYAYNDYCIALVAKGLGNDSIAKKYNKQSANWMNIWNPNIKSDGTTGFIWPRKRDGSWDPNWNVHQSEGWRGWLYEGNSWEYSLYVPHDVSGLINKAGGSAAFQKRLDTFFTKNSQTFHSWLNDYYNVNNEPAFLTPTLYNNIGKPFKTSETVRSIIMKGYTTKPDGLPGNDDAGSMSAWYAFHAMGFFPVAGQDLYMITTPMFESVVIHLGDNKELKIVTKGLSPENIYIKSAKLNGKKLDRSWFTHTEIKNGANIEFEMSSKPSDWATNSVDIPSLKF
ncbi:MAG TPA: GH92 family glycosyl hydrolase [Flavisolibacter sp.]|nr:GH92 family glycosyl hydrolase [Flavisolibacter sp.]